MSRKFVWLCQMSRAVAMSWECARATEAAHGWTVRPGRPAAARSAFSLTRRAASRASADSDEAVDPADSAGRGGGRGESAPAGPPPAKIPAGARPAASGRSQTPRRSAIDSSFGRGAPTFQKLLSGLKWGHSIVRWDPFLLVPNSDSEAHERSRRRRLIGG